MADPFAPAGGRDGFTRRSLCVGAKCSTCDRAVCIDAACSIFYAKRFCRPCAQQRMKDFPAQIQKAVSYSPVIFLTSPLIAPPKELAEAAKTHAAKEEP